MFAWYVYICLEGTPDRTQGLFLAPGLGIITGGIGVEEHMWGFESELAVCKANTPPAILSLWPLWGHG